MLRLKTLGELAIESPGEKLTGAAVQPRPLGLLALLAVAGEQGISRDELLIYLWPDSTPERARNVLKQTLYAIRRDLHAPDLILGPNPLRLNPSAITSDYAELHRAHAAGDATRVRELYAGPFLQGFRLRESPEFEQWRTQEAERLNALLARPPAAAAVPQARHHDVPGDDRATVPAAPAARRRRRVAIAAGVAAMALGMGFAAVHGRGAADVSRLQRDLVFIAPFTVLDERLALWREGIVDVLARDFDGAGPLRSVAPAGAIGRSRERGGAAGVRGAAASAGAGLAITGAVLVAGQDSARLSATVLDVATGRQLGDADIRGPMARMDQLTDSLAVSLLRDIGRTRGITAVHSTSLRAASLPALKAFLQGEQFYRESAFDSAIVYYERAVALDTTLALGYYRLANALAWSRPGTEQLQESFSARASALTHGLAPADSLLLTVHALFSRAMNARQATPDAIDPELIWETPPATGVRGGGRRDELWAAIAALFSTLDVALRRYPDHPDLWYHLGEARVHFGPLVGVRNADAMAAFDRAIAIDSEFAPAYEHTTDVVPGAAGLSSARRHARAYLAKHPESVSAAGLKAFLAITEPGVATDAVVRILDSASTSVSEGLFFLLKRSPDTVEAAVRLLRREVGTDPAATYPSIRPMGARVLAYRGHMREALRLAGGRPDPRLVATAARLGLMDRDSAAAMFAGWLRARIPRASEALPWWTAAGDTASLGAFVRWQASFADSTSVPRLRALHEYWSNAGRGYLALARGDSAAALGWFDLAPDTVCATCIDTRLARARLLAAVGRFDEAASILDDRPEWIDTWPSTAEVEWMLERGRVAERRGHTEEAEEAYRMTTQVWRDADPELQPLVRDARAGLLRLGGRAIVKP